MENIMVFIRPIGTDDLDALFELAGQTGYGMTTLPPDRAVLLRRIEESQWAFSLKVEKPRGETYLFVLEDSETRRVAGVCGIVSKVGGFDPFYSYRLRTERHCSTMLNVDKHIPMLELAVNYDGPAIVGSLFLLPEFRKEGNGRFLSLARFLFMAQCPHRFDPHVLAEMRGVIDAQGRSAFWDAVGRHFFDVDFPQADYLTMADKEFIAGLMPKYPLYVPLLPPAAQAVIGKVHPDTQPALKILMDEGFAFENLVDIFEAGAVYGCAVKDIRAVRECRTALFTGAATPGLERADYVVSNGRMAFRACKTAVQVVDEQSIRLDPAVAELLEIQSGDRVHYVSLRGGAKKP
jgi:arginine N-succinyltransferase